MLLETIGSVWSGHGSSGPRALFLNSEPGFYLDFSTTQPLYQDNLAATPLTLPDQSVGLAADRSRARSPITVAAAVQASLGLRPKWGRMPKGGRRNRLFYTSQFDNAAWGKFGPSVTPNTALAPNGSMTADTLTMTGASDYLLQATSVTLGEITTFSTWIRTVSGSAAIRLLVDSGSPGNVSPDIPVTTAWQRISFTGTITGTGSRNVGLQGQSAGGTVQYYIWNGQFDTGGAATADQIVTNAFDVTEAGVPSYGYIRPDLMDDFLTVTTPAAQTGDVMVFGRKGTWLETGVAYGSGAAVAIGPTTMTGLPAGLLAAVQGPVSDISGGLVGVLAIGRTLTATERTAALNYYKARGAAGLLAAGANAVVNGGFDTDTSWTKGTGWTISGGKAVFTSGGTQFANIYQTLTTVVGAAYLVEYTLDLVSADNTSVKVHNDNGIGGVVIASENFINAPKSGRIVFIATATTSTVALQANISLQNLQFDNISVKPLTVTP